MTSDPKVLVETDGPVTTVIINRPAQRNAVDAETALLLRAAFAAFDADETALVAVLCGAGSSFCAGYDLKQVAAAEIVDDVGDEGRWGRAA